MEPPSSLPPLEHPAFPRPEHLLLGVVWALTGGLFAIFGAIVKEVASPGPLLAILIAPVVEEVLKPSGVYYLLERRVRWLSSRIHVALLSMLGGMVFAAVENVIYLYVYIPDHPPGLALYRWTVCTALHGVCSFILGLGLGKLLPRMRRGEPFELEDILGWVIAAVVVHAGYNTVVMFFGVVGWRLY